MKIAIVGSGANVAYHRMLINMGHETVPVRAVPEIREVLDEGVDAMLFVGGADVNPEMYGHTTHPTTAISKEEDELYEQAFCQGYEYHLKMIGICRGSQFLCVKAGGTLVQHCDNHAFFGGHEVQSEFGNYIVTSTHHQMQHPANVKHNLLAWADLTTKKLQHINGETVDVKGKVKMDIEVVYYPTIDALAFQPHPEFPNAESTLELFKKCFSKYVDKK